MIMSGMVNDGDRCRKETILPILLSNPILFVPDDEAYKSWILVGLDLDVPTDKLQRIKKWAKAKGNKGLLHGVVVELIEEWLNEQARMGERASVRDLISALRRNNLTSFSEALESAFQQPIPHPMSTSSLAENRTSNEEEAQQDFHFTPSVNPDCDLVCQKSASIPSILIVPSSEDLLNKSSFNSTEDLATPSSSSISMSSIATVVKLEQNVATDCDKDSSSTKTVADTSVGGAPPFWPISPTSSVSSSKSSSFSYVSVNYEKENGNGSPFNSFHKETEQIDEKNGAARTTTTGTGTTNTALTVELNTSADAVAFLPITPKIEITSLKDEPYSPQSSFDIFPHSTDLQGSTLEDGELVADNETQQQKKQQQREKDLLGKLKNLQEAVKKLEQQQQLSSSSSRSSSHREECSSRNKRKYDDDDDADESNKRKKRHHHHRSPKKEPLSKSKRGRFNETDRHGLNTLHLAVKENRMFDVLKLINEGANVNERTYEKRLRTPLHLAASYIRDREDAITMIKLLIDNGARLDLLNAQGILFIDGLFIRTEHLKPISSHQFHEFVEFLISRGHSKFLTIHSKSFHNGGSSALQLAMKENILDTDTILVLQRNRINLNHLSLAGNSLLFYAIWGGRSIKIIKYLVHCCNAKWRGLNNDGWNVLHMAARHCHEDAFEYFLKMDKGLLKCLDKGGDTPVDIARQYREGNERIKEILKKEGVTVKW